ncbi:androgen-dependent TFPI-regulating protein-like [Ischnura elegans]|uniref:androgen-dependent TFPI-regulating protein-like n=1 Tax=Ischnura elegans TaxID=197161 RepID=UPI001ED8ACA1|nr:androgen-dependent TFPI-regulating protein-like [Ischnura elegans]
MAECTMHIGLRGLHPLLAHVLDYPSVIYPVDLDLVVPRWMNHVIHTNILVLIILEVILCPHDYSPRSESFPRMCVVPVSYIICLLTTIAIRGTWPYPLLGMIGHLGRFLFFPFSFLVVWLSSLAGERINAKLWGESSNSQVAQKKDREQIKIH